MFSRVILDNFASFDHFEFNLIENKTDKKAKNLAIIYGENSIGKTCLTRCFEFLKQSYDSLSNIEELNNFFGQLNSDNKRGYDDDLIKILNQSLEESRISGYLKKYYKIGAADEMKLLYELIINKRKYTYSMAFDNNSIVQEKLLCDGMIIFTCSNGRLELSDNHFYSNELNDRLRASFKMFFGEKHTFLACIKSVQKNIISTYFKKNISNELKKFLIFLDTIIVVIRDENQQLFSVSASYSDDFLYPIANGNYSNQLTNKLKRTENALSMFFSSLYSCIKSVHYQKEIDDSGKQRYHLYFIEDKDDKTISIPYEMESTGTKKLVSLFTCLYEVAKYKKTIIIDEIDNGINDILLRSIFDSIDNSISGQLISTTHNTLLLKHSIKKNIYLLDRDENNNVCAYSLDEFGRKIQAGTDIIGQYIKGRYGGIPQSGSFSMQYIIEALEDNE